jgi:hypothetical protein
LLNRCIANPFTLPHEADPTQSGRLPDFHRPRWSKLIRPVSRPSL